MTKLTPEQRISTLDGITSALIIDIGRINKEIASLKDDISEIRALLDATKRNDMERCQPDEEKCARDILAGLRR